MAEFNGIREYHDGLAISDYVNMIPLGTTCVDRVGDYIMIEGFHDNNSHGFRGAFVDSLHNIYVAYGKKLYRYSFDVDTKTITDGPTLMQMYVDGEFKPFEFFTTDHKITFCESSLKPSEVFCCDGHYIYAWANYQSQGVSRPQYRQYAVNVMCPPNITRLEETPNGVIVAWGSDTPQPDFNSLIFGNDKFTPEGTFIAEKSNEVIADTITWFDNRLVCTQLSKNTVWVSRTDPMYYWRDANSSVSYLDHDGAGTGGYELWANWYSSSSSSDRLLNVCAYNGQLYFFNEHTIEIWGRTGNEDNPIQGNTQQVLHYGGTMPAIIDGVLYFVGFDSMRDVFIGAFTPQFTRISNKAIERRLKDIESLDKISQYGETYLFVRERNGDGFMFGHGMWWRWKNSPKAHYKIVTSLIQDYAISSTMDIVRFYEISRMSGYATIERLIRDGFVQFPNRAIVRKIELVADTGRDEIHRPYFKDASWTPGEAKRAIVRKIGLVADTDIDEEFVSMSYHYKYNDCVYCAVSLNRGLSFSQRRYRKFGEPGHNNKVIEWRNMGSSNSLLVEIGTSAMRQLQIYDIKVTL